MKISFAADGGLAFTLQRGRNGTQSGHEVTRIKQNANSHLQYGEGLFTERGHQIRYWFQTWHLNRVQTQVEMPLE
jgi:hypothetical protein